MPDRNGFTKRRPLLIITATRDILLDQPIVGLAVTTTFPDPPPLNCVPLPWQPEGHPATGLRRRSAAVCNWPVVLRPSEIDQIAGYVPTKTLLRVLSRVAEISSK